MSKISSLKNFWKGLEHPPTYLDNVFKYTLFFFWRYHLPKFIVMRASIYAYHGNISRQINLILSVIPFILYSSLTTLALHPRKVVLKAKWMLFISFLETLLLRCWCRQATVEEKFSQNSSSNCTTDPISDWGEKMTAIRENLKDFSCK